MAYTTIDDPSVYFQIGLYTGNGNNNKNINLGSANFTGEYVGQDIQPDLVWIKNTDTNGKDHGLWDSSRGTLKQINTNNTQAENNTANSLTSFNSNGFTLGSDGGPNAADDAHVAWVWKANAGSKTSVSATGTAHESTMAGTHQANTTAGFSIVEFSTASESAGDKLVTHGIGKIPEMIITKELDGTNDWFIHHKQANTNDSKFLKFSTGAVGSTASRNSFDTSNITTTQFAVDRDNVVNDNKDYIAYCFAPIKGYSRFGIYRGNGSADGTFVFTGFKPSFLMFKALSGTEGWGIFDNKRNTQSPVGNPRDIYLQPNNNNANSSESDSVDFLSNGFKWRIDSGFRNGDGVDFIYMAFAENPFTSSEGVPATAG